MILRNSLYRVVSSTPVEGGYDYRIALDREHFIYKAHFPGEPITPGVCIMQTAVELLSDAVGRPMALEGVKNIKFLQIIVPDQTPSLLCSLRRIEMDADRVKVQVTVSAEDTIFAKLSLTCVRSRQ